MFRVKKRRWASVLVAVLVVRLEESGQTPLAAGVVTDVVEIGGDAQLAQQP